MNKIIVCFAFVFCVLFQINKANAQLPKIEVVTAVGRNIVSWVNPYNDLFAIRVQRSNDSSKNYIDIGTLKKPKKGSNVFSDDVPLKGKNFYQVIVVFNPDVEWPSMRKGIYLDDASIAKSMTVDSATAGNAAKNKALEANPTLALEEVKPVFTFTPSNHVYTNSYTGHINIVLENTISKRYSLQFFGTDKKEAFRLDRISHDSVVLDKHNFNGKGTFSFVLLEDGKEIEKGFVNVY
jgi:hypothetical protein